MRRIAGIRGQVLVGLAVWMGTSLTLYTIGLGLTNLARINQSRCRVRLDPPPAAPMLRAQDPPVAQAAHFEVPRATLDRWSEIARRESRIVPEVRDGLAIGFRVWAVRPDGLIAAAGFRNGDVVVAVNGYELTSPDKALKVYTKLRNARHYTIDIERRGRRMKLELDPVPSIIVHDRCGGRP